uniref:Uncharacterized protein n=1 Tax=Wuchereria bancrofti TaxID=6293 RepID=A0A1I8ER92_WUCBA
MRTGATVTDIWKSSHSIVCVHDHVTHANKRCLPIGIPGIEMPIVEPHPIPQAPVIVGLRKQPNYNFHPVVVGKPFRKEDIRIEELDYQQHSSSVFGINDGCDMLESLRDRVWVNEYVLKGQLGRRTIQNKIEEKAYTHRHMSRVLMRLQAHYKKLAFELANVDLESQEALELARNGLPGPKILGAPIIYFIKLKLTLSSATFYNQFALFGSCRQLLRTQLGPFNCTHSLLDKHFTMKNILRNMQSCEKIIKYDG